MDIYICMVRKYIVAHSPTDPLRMNNGQAFEYKNTNSLSSPAPAPAPASSLSSSHKRTVEYHYKKLSAY